MEADPLGDLFGLESASEGGLLCEDRANHPAQTVRERILEPLLDQDRDAFANRPRQAVANVLDDPLAK